MTPDFSTAHNVAYTTLGALPPYQGWSAFDVPMEEARSGNASLFVMTVWNFHRDDNDKPIWPLPIKKDARSGTYWYKVAKPSANSSTQRKALWAGIEIGKRDNLTMLAILKDGASKKCSLPHTYQIGSVMYEHGGTAVWLMLIPNPSAGIGSPVEETEVAAATELAASASNAPLTIMMSGANTEEVVIPADLVSEVLREVWVRGPQHAAFRDALHRRWRGTCSVHGVSCNGQLRASHIVAWSLAPELRADVNNGLLLSVPLDSLFDRGFITFSNDGAILLSKQISEDTKLHFGIRSDLRLAWDRLSADAKNDIRRNLKKHRETHTESHGYHV